MMFHRVTDKEDKATGEFESLLLLPPLQTELFYSIASPLELCSFVCKMLFSQLLCKVVRAH